MAIASHPDKALWCAFKSGNREALDTIFRTYYPMLYAYGYKICSNAELIEDCLQDFFLYLFDQRGQLANLDKIKPYLFKAFRRRLMRYLEKSRVDRRKQAMYACHVGDIQFSADELIIEQEEENMREVVLLDMLNHLPRQQREVILLRYYHDLSIPEVADVLNITYQGTVNTLYKAMKALRKNENLQRIIAFLSHLILVHGLAFHIF